MTDDQPIRDAATLILIRERAGVPHILMGQRGAGAVFMPSRYVFPGGRIDAGDAAVPLATGLAEPEAARLATPAGPSPAAIAAAAIRELWEETGLRLAVAAPCDAPAGWERFCAPGLTPAAGSLSFVFRAITPPGRPRRFDARFLMADAAALHGDPDDFSQAGDELSHVHWLPLEEARHLPTPFVTRVVLGEVARRLADPGGPHPVPFFDHADDISRFRAL